MASQLLVESILKAGQDGTGFSKRTNERILFWRSDNAMPGQPLVIVVGTSVDRFPPPTVQFRLPLHSEGGSLYTPKRAP